MFFVIAAGFAEMWRRTRQLQVMCDGLHDDASYAKRLQNYCKAKTKKIHIENYERHETFCPRYCKLYKIVHMKQLLRVHFVIHTTTLC